MTRLQFLSARRSFILVTLGLVLFASISALIGDMNLAGILSLIALCSIFIIFVAMIVDDRTREFLHTADEKLLEEDKD